MLPDNSTIDTWSTGVAGARNLLFSERADLLVSVPGDGRIVILDADEDGDGRADSEVVIPGLPDGGNHPKRSSGLVRMTIFMSRLTRRATCVLKMTNAERR